MHPFLLSPQKLLIPALYAALVSSHLANKSNSPPWIFLYRAPRGRASVFSDKLRSWLSSMQLTIISLMCIPFHLLSISSKTCLLIFNNYFWGLSAKWCTEEHQKAPSHQKASSHLHERKQPSNLLGCSINVSHSK